MTTTINLDPKIRLKASKRAKKDNMSLSGVIRLLLNDYAEGKLRVGIVLSDESEFEVLSVDSDTQKTMDSIGQTWSSISSPHATRPGQKHRKTRVSKRTLSV